MCEFVLCGFIGRRRSVCVSLCCVVYWEEEVRVCEFVLCVVYWEEEVVCEFVLCVFIGRRSVCVSVVCVVCGLLGGGGPCV